MNSHYVPYWYLRKFAYRDYTKDEIDNRQVKSNIYNKKSKISRKELLDKIASEDSYYADHIEKLLKITEDKPQKIYKNILENKNIDCLKDIKQRGILALTIMSLDLRTKWSRDILMEEHLKPEWEERGYSFVGTGKSIQEDLFLRPDVLAFQATCLCSKKWVLLVNNTKDKFWSSDNPVFWGNTGEKDFLYGDCYFPLSPDLLLWITSDDVLDCITTDANVSEDFVRGRNMITYLMAHEYVISNKKIEHSRIKEIELLVKENPPIVEK